MQGFRDTGFLRRRPAFFQHLINNNRHVERSTISQISHVWLPLLKLFATKKNHSRYKTATVNDLHEIILVGSKNSWYHCQQSLDVLWFRLRHCLLRYWHFERLGKTSRSHVQTMHLWESFLPLHLTVKQKERVLTISKSAASLQSTCFHGNEWYFWSISWVK